MGFTVEQWAKYWLNEQRKNAICKVGLRSDYSVDDVLFAYSKAYAVEMEPGTVDYELPANWRNSTPH